MIDPTEIANMIIKTAEKSDEVFGEKIEVGKEDKKRITRMIQRAVELMPEHVSAEIYAKLLNSENTLTYREIFYFRIANYDLNPVIPKEAVRDMLLVAANSDDNTIDSILSMILESIKTNSLEMHVNTALIIRNEANSLREQGRSKIEKPVYN